MGVLGKPERMEEITDGKRERVCEREKEITDGEREKERERSCVFL